jgi:hypothetical protein
MILSAVQSLYDATIRRTLPRKIGVLNGVSVRRPRLFDATDVNEGYEGALIAALRARVEPSDEVVIVGGGLGVSSVVAARRGRHVTTFEAGDRYETLLETLEMNRVADRVTPRKALVGPAVSVNGTPAETSIEPSELPACDVLELDCEGSELAILRGLERRPRVIVVECHAVYDSPESAVREELDRLGYAVVERGAEVPEEGVFVLTAVREDAE